MFGKPKKFIVNVSIILPDMSYFGLHDMLRQKFDCFAKSAATQSVDRAKRETSRPPTPFENAFG